MHFQFHLLQFSFRLSDVESHFDQALAADIIKLAVKIRPKILERWSCSFSMLSLHLFHISNICLLFARSGLDCGGIPGGKKCKLWMPRKTPDMRTGEGSILASACGLDSTSSVFAEVKKGSQLWQFFTERHS